MKNRIVIDGNAFYEIDEACMRELERRGKGKNGRGEEISQKDSGEKKGSDPA
ncbi:MAG: hypothetical protein Q4F83_14560 [Eubacteriales bacterium]|nr:hypothetical protein [Eubacteriales bacterium]